MKKFETPVVDIVKIEVADVITASGDWGAGEGDL